MNRGCFNPGEFIITKFIYYYEVKAVNACGASDYSARTTGYRGLPIEDEETPLVKAAYTEEGLPDADISQDGITVLPYAVDADSEGLFPAGLGDVYEVLPRAVYPSPVRIQIPVPAGRSGETATVYYYGADGAGGAWYAADEVAGWLAAPLALSDDGLYLEAWVNHGGIIRAGRLPGEAVPVAGSIWPRDYGTVLLLALTAGLLAIPRRRRNVALGSARNGRITG